MPVSVRVSIAGIRSIGNNFAGNWFIFVSVGFAGFIPAASGLEKTISFIAVWRLFVKSLVKSVFFVLIDIFFLFGNCFLNGWNNFRRDFASRFDNDAVTVGDTAAAAILKDISLIFQFLSQSLAGAVYRRPAQRVKGKGFGNVFGVTKVKIFFFYISQTSSFDNIIITVVIFYFKF